MWLAKSWQMVGSVGILADVLPTNPTTCQLLPNNECLLGRYPPSVFACVKPSLQRTPAPATRATKRTYSEVRNQCPDELNFFNEADRILNHETFKSEDEV